MASPTRAATLTRTRFLGRRLRTTPVYGSHRIYGKGALGVTAPLHSGAVLHPKIVKPVLETIEDTGSIAPQNGQDGNAVATEQPVSGDQARTMEQYLA
jgi:hypothetical protein